MFEEDLEDPEYDGEDFGEVTLSYRKGNLAFQFIGKLNYDDSYEDDLFTGWSFTGSYFSARLYETQILEITSIEKPMLKWKHRLLTKQSADQFFIGLINGLTSKGSN